MTEGLKPYPAYKDSGIPWLATIPASWTARRNGRLFVERTQTGFSELPILEVSLRTGVRVRDLGSSYQKQVMMDRHMYKRACAGDITYNMMRMWQGAVGVPPVDGLVSPAYVVARPSPGTVSEYYGYLFRTPAYMEQVNLYSRGIVSDRNRLYWDDFKRIYSPCPPPDEQVAIVRFLKHADGRIRRYIRAKQKLITLLEEQKRTIIQRAVTRGLDPDFRLKPSGVDWVGSVPEHWEVVSLRHRYSVQLGKMLDAKRIRGEHLVPYLRNSDVQWDNVRTDGLPMMDIHPSEYARYTLTSGDLLVCEGGEVGRAAIWPGATGVFGFQKALHRLRPLRRCHDCPRFLFYVFFDIAKRGVFRSNANENTIAHLTAERLRKHAFVFPPLREQLAIIDFLDQEVKRITSAISAAQREITLLRKYHIRLISDVVTGKLDVREAAVRAPDESDESELLGDTDALDQAEESIADDLDVLSEEFEA